MLKILVGSDTFSCEELQYSQTHRINFQHGPDTRKQPSKKPVMVANDLQMLLLQGAEYSQGTEVEGGRN